MANVGKGNVYLKWQEPAAVRRLEWASAVRKERVVISAVSFAALLLLRAISVNPNSPSWPVSVLIALGGAVFFGVFMPWFVSIFPGQILVSTKGINRNAPRMWGQFGIFAIEFWKWEGLRAYAIGTQQIGGKTFRTITLFGEHGRTARVGLAEKVSENALQDVLRQHGVKIAPQ
jgi:hypothetical protein